MKKRHKDIAHKIVALEKKAQEEPEFDPTAEMTKLIAGLRIESLLEIDEYIQKNLLTK